ncbi:MAG: ubiquitin-conjugating enzyme E2 variant [Candidatus Hodarchaeales archaeon]|jgi:ubiquitin-protein ligase
MDRDFILAREAQLTYSNNAASGFNPVGESLARWQGTLTYTTNRGRNMFTFELFLPEYFPNVPPVVTAIGWMDHPNIDKDGFIQLRILDNWRAEFHLYQVIIALKNLMSRVPPTPRGETAKSVRDTMVRMAEPVVEKRDSRSKVETKALRTELTSMNAQLTEKDEELARLRARSIMSSEDTSGTRRMKISDQEELESERIAISDLLSSLEDRYAAGEISIFEYSRLYKKYTKELYLLRKQLQYLS